MNYTPIEATYSTGRPASSGAVSLKGRSRTPDWNRVWLLPLADPPPLEWPPDPFPPRVLHHGFFVQIEMVPR